MGGRGSSSSATKMNTGGGGSFSILTDKDAQAMRDLQESRCIYPILTMMDKGIV